MRQKTYLVLVGLLFIAAHVSAQRKSGQSMNMDMNMGVPMPVTAKSAALHTTMRELWEDHITWTRNVICCLVDGLPGADQAVQRLLQNQDDMGNALKPYYGNDAGTKLTALLHDHITISADVVKAAKAEDNAKLTEANNRWTANADQISTFLSGANPNWKLEDMKSMMRDHLKLTTDEALARIKKDYPADVAAYDKVRDEIRQMSDMLSDGIVKQFPDKFGEATAGRGRR